MLHEQQRRDDANHDHDDDAINKRLNAMMGNWVSQTITVEPSIDPSGETEQLGDKDDENSND